MIKCDECSMVVHVECDRMFNDKELKAQFLPAFDQTEDGFDALAKKEATGYRCPTCRRQARSKLLEQIVDILIAEDKAKYFLTPFWETMPGAYLDIIKKPICFNMIKSDIQKTKKYLL